MNRDLLANSSIVDECKQSQVQGVLRMIWSPWKFFLKCKPQGPSNAFLAYLKNTMTIISYYDLSSQNKLAALGHVEVPLALGKLLLMKQYCARNEV